MLRFGPIVSNVIRTWRLVESECKISCKWHTLSPLFNNKGLLIGGRPISPSYWSNSDIHYLKDIYSDTALRSFQDIRNSFNLPGSSFFFCLQIRSALKAYGVPWQQPLAIHPFYRLIAIQSKTKGLVSSLYKHILKSSCPDLTLNSIWKKDYPALDPEFDWKAVWVSIKEASRNPDHQQIHFNFIHRTNLTPGKLYYMNLTDSPSCCFCTQNSPGTFLHMMWDCPPVAQFWADVASTLSDLVSVSVPASVPVMILNDLSELNITRLNKCILLAGLTAAKKMIVTRWKPSQVLNIRQWILTFLDVVYLELSTARIHRATEKNVYSWSKAAELLKNLLR